MYSDAFGYGVFLFSADIDENDTSLLYLKGHEKEFKDFVKRHKDAARDEVDTLLSSFGLTLEDEAEAIIEVFDYYEGEFYCSLWSFVANVISKETGIDVDCYADNYQVALMLLEREPWDYNEKEKELTMESFNEILLRYFKELGIETITCETICISED